ncbi:hypothetical protein A3D77_03260 [Candidatus Gottesmanbacteria bacterium RIFCSPHIGHO2_02_FULL_39_11]|uniref:Fibronectin type-III domain-containing protein n=1 Tax=Candidatus Gottesmanbacteria bacterium RIFCSPHIGHO2_02_FULL_39_11 TaxID=1798382 RepID=A0A1F5ZNA0_9BACT|nr:MAG: hypothetical protein A3D77_03260 [Candidatus Gottesmanbacteria bacterium RIFCSPHIGHO2_02_FULL_39_11]
MKKTCLRFVLSFLVILLSFIKISISSPVLASDCTSPGIPSHFSAMRGPGAGEVTLYWDQVPGANRYALAYGTESGNYIYGADHIGEEPSRSYTVSSLNPSTNYYFVLSAAKDSCAGGFSQEAMSVSQAGTINPSWSSSGSVSNLQAQPGANPGEVNLKWNDVSEASNYHLVYGSSSQVNKYGALNIGKQTHFTVSKLRPGEKYYFSIIPVKNDQVVSSVGPVSAYSASSVQTVSTTTPAPTMILKDLPPPASPTQTQVIKPTLIPTQVPRVSSEPSYFVP